MKQKISKGDIVCIRWLDHYRWKGKRPTEPIEVWSWGKVDEINKDGIALVQNEVQRGEHEVERVMDGQYVLVPNIIEIIKL